MLASSGTQTLSVTVRYFAAACAAASVEEETLAVPDPSNVQDVLDRCVQVHGAALSTVLDRCSFLLDEVAVHDRAAPVLAGQALDILPPFAGG